MCYCVDKCSGSWHKWWCWRQKSCWRVWEIDCVTAQSNKVWHAFISLCLYLIAECIRNVNLSFAIHLLQHIQILFQWKCFGVKLRGDLKKCFIPVQLPLALGIFWVLEFATSKFHVTSCSSGAWNRCGQAVASFLYETDVASDLYWFMFFVLFLFCFAWAHAVSLGSCMRTKVLLLNGL